MSNKTQRADLRRSGQVIPERIRQVSRSHSKAPKREVFDSIEYRLKNNVCPVCGAAIAERSNPKKLELCVNGHPQDVWKPQRPKEKA